MIEYEYYGITIYLMSRMRNNLKDKGWKRDNLPTRIRMNHLDYQQIFKKKFKVETRKVGKAISLAEKDLHDVIECQIGIDENCIGKKCIGAISLDGNSNHYFEFIFNK